MTVIDDRQVFPSAELRRGAVVTQVAPVRGRPTGARGYRPHPARPDIAPMRYRGTGVGFSRAPHARRPVSTAVTIALAGVAALITLWLGLIGHVSGAPVATDTVVPDQLAVVQVQAGESLQQLAGRVAPDAPAGQVMQRIRDLNKLDSSSLDAGQTLIAPIG
ncbi:LysM peptidoglycan-binding domain-containing protein [Mycobacterium sp. CVI_P3]|uniref:LysM peptidoglycan-binding domain-containing protein n=1 Tax=Mycobacterium pinniadriaticum TaxID=2994102 RepID=A0ABT3SGY1_9MYCO|nr:LysM peptidoglycan-binding domain-containing protein [Mycobacterium pinniadriaticum]MCX2932192.1 LysM peptidoglycan-binding domain-containing protein [Mycobacterium pinniadriaticum]MCX2938708.1 LysM peptidoglycan-binding domain-containing protein [Mycobacterium pinniadriaticum]